MKVALLFPRRDPKLWIKSLRLQAGLSNLLSVTQILSHLFQSPCSSMSCDMFNHFHVGRRHPRFFFLQNHSEIEEKGDSCKLFAHIHIIYQCIFTIIQYPLGINLSEREQSLLESSPKYVLHLKLQYQRKR